MKGIIDTLKVIILIIFIVSIIPFAFMCFDDNDPDMDFYNSQN